MSGRIPGRRPDTDPQWARDVEDRLRTLEQGKTTIRVGSWVITERGGELIAVTVGREVPLSSVNPSA